MPKQKDETNKKPAAKPAEPPKAEEKEEEKLLKSPLKAKTEIDDGGNSEIEQTSQTSIIRKEFDPPASSAKDKTTTKNEENESTKTDPMFRSEFDDRRGKLLIYFHGNAEDLGITYYNLDCLREVLGVRVRAMEYRGYGLYGGTEKNADKVLEDAL